MDNSGFEADYDSKLTSVRIEDLPAIGNSFTDRAHQITFCWDNITVVTKAAKVRDVVAENNRRNARSERKGLLLGKKAKIDSADRCQSKTILKHVSGIVRPGELVAIMGASGAGKSTLLNTLTFRNPPNLQVTSGCCYANGRVVSHNSLTSVSAYVLQDDLFIPTLTVKELLTFQALVRMDRHISYSQRMQRVNSVIVELGLSKCQDSIIGISKRNIKGISGGEMKRLAFACEVLTNPALFFCDEPTSGLDSYMAQNVVEVLRRLSKQGKTIICTIHQPSSQVYALFDRVLLMAEGQVAFLGKESYAKTFFRSVGYPCPENFNPADHFMNVLAVTPGKEDGCRNRIQHICQSFRQSAVGEEMLRSVKWHSSMAKAGMKQHLLESSFGKAFGSPYKATWCEQFSAVLWRSWLSVIKEPLLVRVRFMQTIMIALIVGTIFIGQQYDDPRDVMNINGALYIMVTNLTVQNVFAVMQVITKDEHVASKITKVFCLEVPIFLREHFSGMYRTDVYFICKQLADLPIFVAVPMVYVGIYYWMVGLNPSVTAFVYCTAITIFIVQVVVGFGYMMSCLCDSLQVTLAITPTLMIPFMLFGGYFVNSASMPSAFSWLQYFSWYRHGYELLMVNEWSGVRFQCNNAKECPFANGDEVLSFLGFSPDNLWINVGSLLALGTIFRIIGFVAIVWRARRKPIMRTEWLHVTDEKLHKKS